LSYLDKIKQSLVFEIKQKTSEGAFEEHRETIRMMLERAEGENEDLTRMHQEFTSEENAVFDELQRKLGIEHPVSDLLSA
jgi:hypothetical protein